MQSTVTVGPSPKRPSRPESPSRPDSPSRPESPSPPPKKRYALCLYGLHPNDCWDRIKPHTRVYRPHESISRHIVDYNRRNYDVLVDIFIHSYQCNSDDHRYNEEDEDKLTQLYHPVRHIVEQLSASQNSLDDEDEVVLQSNVPDTTSYTNMDSHARSKKFALFLHSMQSSVNLMSQHTKENELAYDVVLLSRSDVDWLQPFDFELLHHKLSKSDTKVSKKKIFTSVWGKNNRLSSPSQVLGYWFCSNQDNIERFANTLQRRLETYLEGVTKQQVVTSHCLFKHHISKLKLTVDFIYNSKHDWTAPYVYNYVHHELQRNL